MSTPQIQQTNHPIGAPCPRCGALLTRSEIGRLYAALRRTRRAGRKSLRRSALQTGPVDATPRASELMPHVLVLLQEAGCRVQKKNIEKVIKARVKQMGYSYRAPALGYALTYLKRVGYLDNPRHGFWHVTPSGRAVQLDERAAREIERSIESNYLSDDKRGKS